jgi:hypothetical protein
MSVAQLGDEYLNPKPNQISIEPLEMWMRLGGMEGVRRMRRNSRALIELAGYAARWNFTESVIVQERMRQDALQLRVACFQLTVRMLLHIDQMRVPFHFQQSIASYHLMTKRLLVLYQNSHAGLYPRLVAALGNGIPNTQLYPAAIG